MRRNIYENDIKLTPQLLKKLQTTQMEMLLELDKVCRKNNINYSIDGGTLLGAARDGHIIPWDDDIDVVMLRSQYEIFFERCQKDLDAKKFFLQEHRTDPECNVGYARIRRRGTTYLRTGHEHMKYQGGIFIDIFVLDGVTDNVIFRPLHRIYCFIIRKLLWAKTGYVLHPKCIVRLICRVLSIVPNKWIFRRLVHLERNGNKKKRKIVRHLTHPYPNVKKCPYGVPYELFEEYTEIDLEGHKFMCVKKYKEYLEMLYGDYTQLPPIEKRKPHIHLSKLEFIEE